MNTKHFKLSCCTPECSGNLLNADTVLEDVWMVKIELAGGQKFTISATRDGSMLNIATDGQLNVVPGAANSIDVVGLSAGSLAVLTSAFGEPKRKFKQGQRVTVNGRAKPITYRQGTVVGYSTDGKVIVEIDDVADAYNPIHFYEDHLDLVED